MTNNLGKIWVVAGIIIILIFFLFLYKSTKQKAVPLDSIPVNATLSGKYVCLPYLDKKREPTEECVFGLVTDEGVYYMVNFGASAAAMREFQAGKHITAKGFVVLKEALSTNQWSAYNMKGIFTITERVK